MDRTRDYYLNKFYSRLYDNIERSSTKIIPKSILISFLNMTSNSRHSLLNKSSILSSEVPKDIFEQMLIERLIRETDEVDRYVLTAKGILEIEQKKDVFNPQMFIQYIDDKFFDVFKDSTKSLSDKEKIILLSLISARAFSADSPMDLKKSDKTTEIWKEITDSSYDLLSSLDVLKGLKKEDLYGQNSEKRNESPVSNLYRHTDALPKKTKGLYNNSLGKQKYYLDVSMDGFLSKEKLSFLFLKIFEKKQLSYLELTDVYDYCNSISFSKSIYLFDPVHLFSKVEYDQSIREILFFS
ncbi:hypothetical protein [Methanomethylovorans sp.]|uniref:hypothetical protein n=1 Tax=Methanomethylovorans sp. TaxID=2758717 RepID=UPI000B307D85|nr:hypothetical protein [Methanomethylovorans sp.]